MQRASTTPRLQDLAALKSKTVFVTVGSTRFDCLLATLGKTDVLSLLASQEFKTLIVQYGGSGEEFRILKTNLANIPGLSLTLDGYDYKPSLTEDIASAELVISHAGSGSILESLRLSKPLIVVVNHELLDDHQSELATEMHARGHLICSELTTLANDIKDAAYLRTVPFPPSDKSVFPSVLAQEMGIAVNPR